MKIKTIKNLKQVYPDLVTEIEESVLERLGIIEHEKKVFLTESERKRVREKAKKLAGI